MAISADGERCIAGTSNEFGTGQFSVCCYNGDGSARWSADVGAAGSTQGVFWVAASADGRFAAAGGEVSAHSGFLTVYWVDDGEQLLNVAQGHRINQVALSGDGSRLLAVFGNTAQLYARGDGGYVLASELNFSPFACNSCALSEHGDKAVISNTQWDSATRTSTGQVVALDARDGQLAVAAACPFAVGVMRVAMVDSGRYWGASLHDGSCVLFGPDQAATPLWQYWPAQANVGTAYGFGITETSDGRVVLACGTNLDLPVPPALAPAPNGGYLYVLDSILDGAPQARLRWGSELAYAANPGISLDREARLVTATDGKPVDEQPGHVSESAGHFYLFDAASGRQLWACPTPMMNWPMEITPDGSRAFGGSDTGNAYYWKLSSP